MDILLIEADARRRVAVASHLARARHRVTICSSVAEAREVLSFLNSEDGAPNAVVIGEDLLSVDGDRFREEMADRFPDADWVPLRADLSLGWLEDWLTKRDRWRPELEARRVKEGSREARSAVHDDAHFVEPARIGTLPDGLPEPIFLAFIVGSGRQPPKP